MSEIFENISNAMADTVDEASKGIIRVEGRKRLPATGIAWRDNLIVTASHVVRRDEGITVGLPDGSKADASLIGRDKNTDLAVLRIEGSLSPRPLAEPGSLRVGHLALAIGKPGESVQTTLGIVSALGGKHMDGFIQTDVVMYPGFSGGPLVDASGQVQGMNTSGFQRGASIAISTHTINRVVDGLLEHGHIRQGFLGIGVQPVRLAEAQASESGQETGLMVVAVEASSPAAKGGILQGDIILSLGGEGTPHLDALLALLGSEQVGQSVAVKIVRGGQIQDVQVTIGEHK